MNIQFSGSNIFLILLLCLVIVSIYGRQTIVEKLTVEKPPLIFYGIDNKGIKNGLTMELIHKKNEMYSFMKTDKSLNKHVFNGGYTVTDTDLIIKILKDLDKEDVELYIEEDSPNNYIYMFKNKCNLYIGVETFTISYLTKINDLTDTEVSPLDTLDKLKKAADELAKSFKKQNEEQTTCGSANCCGNCPNCNKFHGNVITGNVITGNTVNYYNMDELTKVIRNALENGENGEHRGNGEYGKHGSKHYKREGDELDTDKYILKTAIFPVDCPNCNTIGNTITTTTTTTTTLKPATTNKQRYDDRKDQQYNYNLKLKVGLQRGDNNIGYDDRGTDYREPDYRQDDEVGYEDVDEYANAMNYYGALPQRESTEFIPVNSDFSAFAK